METLGAWCPTLIKGGNIVATVDHIIFYFIAHRNLIEHSCSDLACYMRLEEDMDEKNDPYKDLTEIKLMIKDHTKNVESLSNKIYRLPKRYFHIFTPVGYHKSGTELMEKLKENRVIQPVLNSQYIGDMILELGEIIRKDPELNFILIVSNDDKPANTNNIQIGFCVYNETIEIMDPIQTYEKLQSFIVR